MNETQNNRKDIIIILLSIIVIIEAITIGYVIINDSNKTDSVKCIIKNEENDNKKNEEKNNDTEPEKDDNNKKETSNIFKDFDEISGNQIEKLSKSEKIVVLIARDTCSYCEVYAPILVAAQKTYGFKTKYIDLAKMIDMNASSLIITDQDSYNGLFNVKTDSMCVSTALDSSGNNIPCENFISEEFGATPLTLIIKNNKLIYAIAGYVDESTLASHLELAGFNKK